MDGISDTNTQISQHSTIYQMYYIFVCAFFVWPIFYYIFTPIRSSIFKHTQSIQKLFQMWICSLKLDFHPLHINRCIHSHWALPGLAMYSCSDHRNHSDRLLESNVVLKITVIQRYFFVHSSSSSLPLSSAFHMCLCMYTIRMHVMVYLLYMFIYIIYRILYNTRYSQI